MRMFSPRLRARLMAGALAAGVLPAAAGNAGDDCRWRIAADLRVQPAQLRIDGGARAYLIDGNGLRRDGQPVTLDPEAQALLQRYAATLRALVPQASATVHAAARLGIETTALIGAALADADGLHRGGDAVERAALALHRRFDGRSLAAGETLPLAALGDEAAAEALAGTAAAEFAGGIARMVAGALFDPAAARARGDWLERLVERRIEPRARALEARVDRLCAQLAEADALETRLQQFDLLQRESAI